MWGAPFFQTIQPCRIVGRGTSRYFGKQHFGEQCLSGGGAEPVAFGGVQGGCFIANNLGSSVALSVDSLAIFGKLDINNNSLVVHDRTLGTVTTLVQTGYNNGWSGNAGIISSSAAGDGTGLTALGVIGNWSRRPTRKTTTVACPIGSLLAAVHPTWLDRRF